MGSIIIDLQNEMLSSNLKVSDLLRKAYVIARKLKIADFERWIYNELNGYHNKSDIPNYRILTGEIRGWNQFNGWIPVIIPDIELQNKLSQHSSYQGIPEIEAMTNMKEAKGGVHVSLPDLYSKLTGFDTKYKLQLNLVQINGIIETVKNIILEWLLKLEEDGIMGENLVFSNEEKERAVKGNYTVNNFYGDVNHSQIQQNTNNSNQIFTYDLEKINEIIYLLKENAKNIETDQDDEIDDAVQKMETEIKKSNPSMNIIKESLKTIRTVLEGIAGSIIASGILYKISQL
jgi:hypothetical protein